MEGDELQFQFGILDLGDVKFLGLFGHVGVELAPNVPLFCLITVRSNNAAVRNAQRVPLPDVTFDGRC